MRIMQSVKRHFGIVSILVLLSMAASGCVSTRIVHIPPTRAGAPYSRAVWVGDTLYLAGDGGPLEDAAMAP